MENAINYKNRTLQTTAVAVMNDVLNSDVYGTDTDDLYDTVCKYAKITKEKFIEYCEMAEKQVKIWSEEGFFSSRYTNELSDSTLDMVVGGGIGDFFSAIGNGIKNAACAVGNFVKEHAVTIGLVVGTVAACTLGGAVFFGGAAALGMIFGTTAAEGLTMGLGTGLAAGVISGALVGVKHELEN